MISKQAEGVHCVLSGYPGLECLLELMMFFYDLYVFFFFIILLLLLLFYKVCGAV